MGGVALQLLEQHGPFEYPRRTYEAWPPRQDAWRKQCSGEIGRFSTVFRPILQFFACNFIMVTDRMGVM